MKRGVALLLFCLFSLPLLSQGKESVQIKSPYGLGLTSSTLRWTSAFIDTDGAAIDAVPVNGAAEDTNSSYICRARHGGHNIIGSTNAKLCRISYFGEVYSYPVFELLTNPSSFARLDWQYWTKYYLIPDGALESRESYVSRVKIDDEYHGGRLESSLGRGKILSVINGEVRETTEGELLVETEPEAYEITDFAQHPGKVKTLVDEEVVLAEVTLANEESPFYSTVSAVLFYDIPYKIYLTHVRGLVKGLKTKIRLSSLPMAVSTDWGKEAEGKFSRHSKEVSLDLDIGTATNVTLKGRRIVRESPYAAKLFAKYPDGKEVIHNIEGIMKSDIVTNIEVIYSDVYFLANDTLAPTTPRTTTTEATTECMFSGDNYSEYDYIHTDNGSSASADAERAKVKPKNIPYSVQAYSGSSGTTQVCLGLMALLVFVF